VRLTVDHVVPVALGGTDEPGNLVAACADCNTGKSSSTPDAPLVEDVAADTLRWKRAMEAAAEILGRERAVREEFCHDFALHWNTWTYELPSYKTGTGKAEVCTYELPGDWYVRVGELMAAGLTVPEMHEAIDTAMSARYVRDEFAYFLGVARRQLDHRRVIAAELLRRGMTDGTA
jgi:hypothetical protein